MDDASEDFLNVFRVKRGGFGFRISSTRFSVLVTGSTNISIRCSASSAFVNFLYLLIFQAVLTGDVS